MKNRIIKSEIKLQCDNDPYIKTLREAEKITGRKFVTAAMIKDYVRENHHTWMSRPNEGEEGEAFRDVEYTKLEMQSAGMIAGGRKKKKGTQPIVEDKQKKIM